MRINISIEPGIDAVLHSFLPILPPAISIIKNIIHAPRLKGEPRSGCFSRRPNTLPPILDAALFFLGHYRRGAFSFWVKVAEPGLGGEKGSPVNISKDLSLQWRQWWWWELKMWVH